MLRSGQSVCKVINVGNQKFKNVLRHLIEINEPFPDITCPLPPHIPINEHYREVKEAQVYSFNKEVRNSRNKIPREESMPPASLIHREKQFLRCSRRLFHNQTSRATSTLLSGQLVVDNSIKMYPIASSAMSVAPQDS